MESFYDIGTSDLKDIWESDLDPSDPMMKLSTDSDMHDWFLERDIKMPQVILHDKLISDALLGNLPIKTEHSYSLNSDGDSMPDSPGSLQTKMDDMDDDCYPTISMTSPTLSSHTKHFIDTSSIPTNHSLTQNNSSLISGTNNLRHHTSLTSNNSTVPSVSRQIQYNGKITMNTNNSTKQQNLTSTISLVDTDSIGSSDIDIDDTCIKDEPMSPESSCPPSPSSNSYTSNLHMANMATFTNTDLVFEHKNGSLKLSPASHQSLLKSQQFILNETNAQNLQTTQRIIIPKCNIKIEPQTSVFGLPPTPPSSLPSDESEGNQSPEHHLISPMSPPINSMPISLSSTSTTALTTVTSTPIASSSSTLSLSSSSTTSSSSSLSSTAATTTVSTRRNSSIHHNNTPASHHTSTSTGRSGYSGSTRQPIHTPLISSQPKGSTGTLVLTEEEKRTLLAEGYPIPTRLPLTKAEEKSLKKIRRKIKNKISAQESRRKKKEYMDQLERKVEILVSENTDYRKRVETLEDSNANLLNQLAKLKAMLNKQNSKNI